MHVTEEEERTIRKVSLKIFLISEKKKKKKGDTSTST
jgi:hypothetical protein